MLRLDLSSFPTLRTERLLLRDLQEEDVHAVFALRSDPGTMRYVPRPLATSLDDARAHIAMQRSEREAGRILTWAITLQNDPAMIGVISLLRMRPEHYRTELGYMLLPAHWGKGYAGEAIAAVVQHAFGTLGFHSLEAVVDPANLGSIKALQRNGFAQEGLFRENCLHNGRFLDSAVFSLLNR